MSIINTAKLKWLWQEAQTHPEWATTRLWEHIFHHIVFNEDKWVVSSQQPPTHQQGDLRRVDLVVEKFDSEMGGLATLLFLEAKRAKADASMIETVEYQAFTAACAHFVETGRERIWTMTCVGSCARLWIFDSSSEYLIPYVPRGEGLAEKSEYLELSISGNTIIDALKFIKKHITPPRELCEKHPSPRPMHASLPQGWNDTEVHQLDTWQRSQMVLDTAGFMDVTQDPGHGTSSMSQDEMGPGPVYATSSWEVDAGTLDQSDMVSETTHDAPPWPPQTSGEMSAQQPPYTPDRFGQGDVGGPSAASSSGQHQSSVPTKGEEKKEVEVKAKLIPHKMNPMKAPEVEYEYKGRPYRTDASLWAKKKHNGKSIWVYEGRKTRYWTHKIE